MSPCQTPLTADPQGTSLEGGQAGRTRARTPPCFPNPIHTSLGAAPPCPRPRGSQHELSQAWVDLGLGPSAGRQLILMSTCDYGYFGRLLQGGYVLVPCPAHTDCSLLAAGTLQLDPFGLLF